MMDNEEVHVPKVPKRVRLSECTPAQQRLILLLMRGQPTKPYVPEDDETPSPAGKDEPDVPAQTQS